MDTLKKLIRISIDNIMTLFATNESKEIIKKYIRIKFDSDDDLPLNNTTKYNNNNIIHKIF